MESAENVAVVRIDYNLFALSDSGLPVTPSPHELAASSGLVCALDAGAVVATGINMGYVRVEVRALDSEPLLNTADSWDEVVDVSLSVSSGDLRVESILGDNPGLPTLTTSGPGVYRLRVCASGRLQHLNEIVETAAESYLLEAWRAPLSAETAHRLQMNRFSA